MALDDFTGDAEDVELEDDETEAVQLNTGNFEQIMVLMMQDLKQQLNEIEKRLDELEDDD